MKFPMNTAEELTRKAVARHLKGRSIEDLATRTSVDEFGNPIMFIDVTLDKFDPVKDVQAYRKIRDFLIEELSSEMFPIVRLRTKEDAPKRARVK